MKKRIILISFWLMFLIVGNSFAGVGDIQTAIMKQDYKTAKRLAEDLIAATTINQNKTQALYYLGLSELLLEDYKNSCDTFNKLLKERNLPANLSDQAYLGLIDAYYLDEDYDNALEAAKKLLKAKPNSPFISLLYYKLARINLKQANWDEARSYLEKTIKDYPQSLEVFNAKQLLDEEQYFAVQVGSFSQRDRAEQLAQELNKKGEYAYVVEARDQGNKKYFRVRVGKLAMLNQAHDLESKLSKQGYPTRIFP
jgi:tetratricopeptide (TPR) repeat protein